MFLLFSVVSNAQWQPHVRLTSQSASSFIPFNYKSTGASGNTVHVVWYDDRDGNFEVYYKRSSDQGISWGADTRLTNNSATSWFLSLAVSGSNVHIIWMDNRDGNFEIYYKRSTDVGLSWSGDTRLTNNSATSQFPSVAVSGSVVNVIWQDSRDGNTEIYYKRSPDGGVNWGSDIRLTNNAAGSIFASVSASDSSAEGGVNVVWEEYRDGNSEIYYKRSSDVGLSWSADTRLTNNTAISFSPSAWVLGSEVHVVWYDGRDGNSEIYYKRSSDGGLSWGSDTRLTNNFAGSFHPSVLASGSNVHLVWYDERDGNREIYYKTSTNAGVSWGTDTRLTNNSSESSHPSVTVSGQSVHVLWQDIRDGNWEIYYERNSSGNPAPFTLCYITAIPEEFYNSVTDKLNRKDTLRAYLRNVATPHDIVGSAKAVIDSVSFTGRFTFTTAPSGNYYIVLNHRNSLETWSKSGGETISQGDTNLYNFTNSSSQAFGNNMIQKGTKFCIYSGDVNQDGTIDGSDGGIVDNDAFNFLTGYLPSDVNGDGIIDGSDNNIVDNNSANFVSKVTP